jgi:hypothetical protein
MAVIDTFYIGTKKEVTMAYQQLLTANLDHQKISAASVVKVNGEDDTLILIQVRSALSQSAYATQADHVGDEDEDDDPIVPPS